MLQSNEPGRKKQYWLGLGLGFIPLVLNLVFFGLSTHSHSFNFVGLLILTLFLYGIELFIWIGLLISRETRFLGYGVLTAFLASPIIAAIGCNVMANIIH